jgi:hypothetical protein
MTLMFLGKKSEQDKEKLLLEKAVVVQSEEMLSSV